MTASEVTQSFLNHVFSGELDKALDLVAPDAKLIAARSVPNPDIPLHGTFVGPEGARELFRIFGEMLEPGDFNIEAQFSDHEHAAYYGTLRHRSRKTGRDFVSDWALICRVREGRLTLYHFYEDTDALRLAVI